jgi:hypothetical protein
MFRNFIFCLFLISSLSSIAQQELMGFDKNYFRSPLGIPLQLTANFGELRPNHWHMGLDIRTQQRENLPVYAAADGYIARIFVHPNSYGKAIYINHPNGLTTLYAHLNELNPEFEKYLVQQQYKNETWAGNFIVPVGLLKVSKGQFIANSGNSGGSMGPHLHFEIRTTQTDKCLNPLLFNFSILDYTPPVFQRLAIYNRDKSVYEQTPDIFWLKKTGEGYLSTPSLIKTSNKKFSFAIGAYDKDNSSVSQQGIYTAKLFIDEKPLLSFKLDSIAYDRTSFINAQIDHKYYTEKGIYLQHLSILPGNTSTVYKQISSNGVIELKDSLPHNVRIEVMDVNKNLSQLFFKIQYQESEAVVGTSGNPKQLYPQMVNIIEENDFEVFMPEDCLYDAVTALYSRKENYLRDAVSAVHQLNDGYVPIQDSFAVRIKPTKSVPEELKKNVVIRNTYNARTSVKKAVWQGGWMAASFGNLGTYQAFLDITPPVLNSLGTKDTLDLSRDSRIVFTPTDDFGIIKNFRAELDGKWLMFTNDKGRNHIYKFDGRCSYGVHELKVTVEDLVGNTTTKSWWFKRYPYTAPSPVKKPVKK